MIADALEGRVDAMEVLTRDAYRLGAMAYPYRRDLWRATPPPTNCEDPTAASRRPPDSHQHAARQPHRPPTLMPTGWPRHGPRRCPRAHSSRCVARQPMMRGVGQDGLMGNGAPPNRRTPAPPLPDDDALHTSTARRRRRRLRPPPPAHTAASDPPPPPGSRPQPPTHPCSGPPTDRSRALRDAGMIAHRTATATNARKSAGPPAHRRHCIIRAARPDAGLHGAHNCAWPFALPPFTYTRCIECLNSLFSIQPNSGAH